MQRIFLWFYCLPIPSAMLVLMVATQGFFCLREKYRDWLYRKAVVRLLFLLWMAVILFGTLGQRTEGGNFSCPVLNPFASYHAAFTGGNAELLRANFMNVVLFYPAGLLGGELFPGSWTRFRKTVLITTFLVLCSIGIECIQYRLGMGLAETDDVIHNTLGVLLGAIVCDRSVKQN